MGCKGSKQTEVENTYGEPNKNIQKTMMLRAGLNLGESSYGIQVGLSKTHKVGSGWFWDIVFVYFVIFYFLLRDNGLQVFSPFVIILFDI